MKLNKKLFWIAIIIAAFYLAGNLAVMFFGNSILSGQIEKNLKLKGKAESLSLGFPFTINIKNLEIENLFRAERIYVSPSILGFLTGRIVLNRLGIIRPEITIIRNRDKTSNLPVLEKKGKQPPVLLAGLSVKDGKFVFIDKRIDPGGYRVAVSGINADISKVAFPPTSLYTTFKLSAYMADKDNKPAGDISAGGWIDFGPKDMDGKIEFKNIDALLLAPYYRAIISTEKLRSAQLNFTSDLKAKNNDLVAKCHAEFANIDYEKPVPVEGQEQKIDLVPSILNIFSDASGKAVFDFTIRTKLDNPRIDTVSLKEQAVKSAVKNVAAQPVEMIIDKAKEVAEQFKEIGKSIEDIFKKKE